MKQQTKSSNITVGLDLGDRRHRFCALDERGEVVEQDSICNDRVSLRKLAGRYHGALGVMEEVPESVREMITPSVQALAELTARIKMLELEINTLAQMKYPQSAQLQQIPGVGPITALYFVLKIEDPNRFAHVRDVGAYAGLCPRRDQSGESDPQLRISKRGDAYLRRLLVSAAHYILGPFGPQSALRAYGLMLAADGTARAKKRATVAVARKLAVLLRSLWKSHQPYQPFPGACLNGEQEDRRSGTIALHRMEATD